VQNIELAIKMRVQYKSESQHIKDKEKRILEGKYLKCIDSGNVYFGYEVEKLKKQFCHTLWNQVMLLEVRKWDGLALILSMKGDGMVLSVK